MSRTVKTAGAAEKNFAALRRDARSVARCKVCFDTGFLRGGARCPEGCRPKPKPKASSFAGRLKRWRWEMERATGSPYSTVMAARRLGRPTKSYRNWEQGRRVPNEETRSEIEAQITRLQARAGAGG